MKILNFKQAADRSAWERKLKQNALRDEVLSPAVGRLQRFPPNTLTNIKHPWNFKERFSIRGWCPLHQSRWARLIVRADEDLHLTFDCSQGCTPDEVERFLNRSTQ